MALQRTLAEIERAWQAGDPALVSLIIQLSAEPLASPAEPVRPEALTFEKFLAEIRSKPFRHKPDEEQKHYRQQTLLAIEAPDAEVPLPERLKLYRMILRLWEANTNSPRRCLLDVIAAASLTYGPWKAFKRIFKEAEAREDIEVLGALAARFDVAFATGRHQVSQPTLGYLVRRAWRYLRRLGRTLPVSYPDAAVEFLAAYPDGHPLSSTWVFNHLLYHNTRQYSASSFHRHTWRTLDPLKERAYADLWKRSPRPLFSLLERAKADEVRQYAIAALKADFRAELREVEPAWVARLVSVGSGVVDEFVVWILGHVPKFEQAAFRELGLHDAVLRLFDSPSAEAQGYAAAYARTHARDLAIGELIRLADHDHAEVHKLALDLLRSRQPRDEVGLQGWGQLLETKHGFKLAAQSLREHFGAADLTPEWLAERLLSPNGQAVTFAQEILPKVHQAKKLGSGYFTDLLERLDFHPDADAGAVLKFCFEHLHGFDLNELDENFLQRLLLRPLTRQQAIALVDEGRLQPTTLPISYYQALAFHPDWDQNPWLMDLRQCDRPWARELEFSLELAQQVRTWMADVRKFSASDLGFDWLLGLVRRSEEHYHNFAVELMIRSFTPADFAPSAAAGPVTPAPTAPASVNLGGATFLFTGKLATMDRKEAEQKVTDAGGTNAGSVTPKLDYLVIGDEGSPLYGAGKKGSKQVKAEGLNADKDAGIKIISETAFLQMLSGRAPAAADSGQAISGCERLWEMLTGPENPDDPLAAFARQYFRRHHADICLAETDRPVDPGAEIPAEFLSFDRFRGLLTDSRKPLRELALEISRWEFARWQPPLPELVQLCESRFPEVRQFVAEALLADEVPETRRFRIDPAVLSVESVYGFCESRSPATRWLGMQLITKHTRLQQPEELFRLTESPDRQVRAFVIRTFWGLYRRREITLGWKPRPPSVPELAGAKKQQRAEQRRAALGNGAPARPEQWPAAQDALRSLLRRVLFEIPPGRLPAEQRELPQAGVRLRPLPHRQAKLALVEVIRDLAIEQPEFAGLVRPLVAEFMGSRGQSEQAACLVALTRIDLAHPELAGAAAGSSAGEAGQ